MEPIVVISKVFEDWDDSGAGVISIEHLKTLLLGLGLSVADFESLLTESGSCGGEPMSSGNVNWRSFLSFVCGTESAPAVAPDAAEEQVPMEEVPAKVSAQLAEPAQPARDPAVAKKKGTALLMAGLRSGEVSKLVDGMEAAEAAPAAAAASAAEDPAEAPARAPAEAPAEAPAAPAEAASQPAKPGAKKRASALLKAGLKSGEVSKLVDGMEAAEAAAAKTAPDEPQAASAAAEGKA